MPRYGLIGYPLTHSFSPAYFKEKFKAENLTDYDYNAFSLTGIKQLPRLLNDNPELRGLNITIPYKKEVIYYLDVCDNVVQKTGSCNCIKICNGKLTGYNTDVTGFEKALIPALLPHHKKALILGTGGSAAAVRYVLDKLGIAFLSVSRNINEDHIISYKDITASLISEYRLIINTTPLGLFPDVMKCPDIPYEYLTSAHYLFDLIYNPYETLFLQKGKSKGSIIKNGLDMLKIQADESWKIWKDNDG